MVSRFVGRKQPAVKPVPVPEAEAPLVSAASSPSGLGHLIEAHKEKPLRCRVEVATSTAKNWGGRHENEDRCMATRDCLGDSRLPFHTVGVLDGHDTDSASDLVAKLLPIAVGRRIKEGLPISQAYIEAMAEMEDRLKSEHATAGTCVNSCTIAAGRVWCANLGDCRAALVLLEAASSAAKAEVVIWLSRDHKASCPIEQKRIEAVGGSVTDGRVEGLEPSRTLGDFDVKMTVKPGVISIVPEVRSVEIAAGSSVAGRRAILMCATDGVWDVMTGQDLCKLIQSRKDLTAFNGLEAFAEASTSGLQALNDLAEDIVQFALAKGSRDDCTCLVAMIMVAPE
mmetsp:Transcript_41069/g.76389  ORF Transcript_41069/g.76389 Transcript_41069/m.76389 type:complete len:340 (+) Transcript_41069:145-1164(+)